MRLREQYKKETGKNWTNTGTDGIHAVPVITVPSFDYVVWLEGQIKMKNRLLKLVAKGKISKDDILDYNLKKNREGIRMTIKACVEQVINFLHGKIYILNVEENGKLTAEEFRELPEVKEIKNTIDVLYKYYSVMEESE